ncbi:hypothetical protein Tco_1408211 [Tanacetum coccineum]
MAYFCSLHSHLQVISKEDLKGTHIEHGFKRAFMSLFGQDNDAFTSTMLLNVDKLQKQLDKDEFQEDESMEAFWVINRQFQKFIDLQYVAERTRHQRQYDRRVNKRQIQKQESKVDPGKALDVGLVVTKSSGTESEVQDDNSRSGNDTNADDADIRPIYDEEPMTEVQLTAECNIFVIGQQHTEQPEIINEGRVDQHPKQCQVKILMLDSSPDNQTNDYSKQSLESKTIEQTTSLLANNVDLKAQIQEKVFAIAALKNELRKLKGNSVDTKPKISKPWFASQVDVEKHLSKPVTQHYLPNEKESAFAKPNHMIASSSSRNSSKNMPRFSSNDMVYNHYLEEAKKKTQEKDRNSKSSVLHSASLQNTTNGSKPQPRVINQTSRSLHVSKSSCVIITVVPKAHHSKNSSSFSNFKHFVCSTCHKCVFNVNHDACITKFLKEVNSRAKVKYHKTRNSNKPINQKSQIQKPNRQIFTGHIFSSNKSFAVYEKTSTSSCLRWKPTGRIFNIVGGTDIQQKGQKQSKTDKTKHMNGKSARNRSRRAKDKGKLLDSCTGKVDSEPPHGSNVDIFKIHECKQTMYLSAGKSINVQKKQSIDLSAEVPTSDMIVMTSMIELESLFGPLFDEYFNGENQVVSKSSVVTTADASDKRQQQRDSTSSTSTLATTVTADGNFDL